MILRHGWDIPCLFGRIAMSIRTEVYCFFYELYYFLTRNPKAALNRYGVPFEYKADGKSLERQMKKCLFDYGMCYEEFMLYDCAGKSKEYLERFVTEIGRRRYFDKYNDSSEKKLFHDKYALYEKFGAYYKREVISVNGKRDFEKFRNFAQRHEGFIVKPNSSSCGHGVGIYTKSGFESTESMFELLFKGGKYVCEQLVRQPEFFSRFNASSINTVRFVSDPTGRNVPAFTPFFRMGRRGKAADNAGAGGLFVSVGRETGRLGSIARDENGGYYREHPDSKVVFGGEMLPEWEKAKELAEVLQSKVKSRLIGWDLAYDAEKGWVMIEGNYMGQFVCQQSCLAKQMLKKEGVKND